MSKLAKSLEFILAKSLEFVLDYFKRSQHIDDHIIEQVDLD
jgi:hypothetical protein